MFLFGFGEILPQEIDYFFLFIGFIRAVVHVNAGGEERELLHPCGTGRVEIIVIVGLTILVVDVLSILGIFFLLFTLLLHFRFLLIILPASSSLLEIKSLLLPLQLSQQFLLLLFRQLVPLIILPSVVHALSLFVHSLQFLCIGLFVVVGLREMTSSSDEVIVASSKDGGG